MKTVIEDKKGAPSRKKRAKGEPKLYEAMFLVDSAEAATDWDGVAATIKNILEKAGAEIVSMRKWDERKLAYDIGGKGKGTYILCYFKAEGKRLRDIERDIQLSERIMRALILCAEHLTTEDIEKASITQKTSEMGTQKDEPVAPAKTHKRKASQTTSADAESELQETEGFEPVE
ncbi:MAG: 30S ribosomal protein S6 [Sedimentisphaerales bacterium]